MTTARPSYAADSLGIGVATGVYGISFGVPAVTAGLSESQALGDPARRDVPRRLPRAAVVAPGLRAL